MTDGDPDWQVQRKTPEYQLPLRAGQLFWIVPLVTWLKWILYVRALGEHHGLVGHPDRPLSQGRTVVPSRWERWLICPFNVSYHATTASCSRWS